MTPSHVKFCLEIDHRHKLYTKHFLCVDIYEDDDEEVELDDTASATDGEKTE
jgi:hypothetical protein